MIDVNELRGIIAKKGLSQADVAKKLGITPKTFYEKMKKAIFTSKEMQGMIKYLEIEDPCSIFFADCVAYKATKKEG
ncbi:helix-turn-helix domain-containing protein [Fusobacterium varium]|uniref:helix-turn-helix domain-containing protein n=1 Tax=Fusobacterium varium TaxID=856 RepID=UPI002FEEC34A